MKNKIRFRAVLMLIALPSMWAVSGNTAAAADDEPTIAKDSIKPTTQHGREGAFEKPGWVPEIEYRVNGPISSGSQLSVEFTLPGKGLWVKFDCPTKETATGYWWRVTCGSDEISNDKAITYSGPVEFTIRLNNELSGKNLTLFTGKMKVVMAPSHPGAKSMDEMTWYVDDDWKIPIGYVFFEKDNGHMDQSFLHVGFWYRGNPAQVESHLFYQGKDIAKCTIPGNGAEDWHPNENQWGFADCNFLGVYPKAPTGDEGYNPKFGLRTNPGEYEVKALVVGHLARSIKFTVDADGKFDNGIATENKLGSHRVIVPVQVIGNQSQWVKNAWKTGAFYGNPLTGFTAAQ